MTQIYSGGYCIIEIPDFLSVQKACLKELLVFTFVTGSFHDFQKSKSNFFGSIIILRLLIIWFEVQIK